MIAIEFQELGGFGLVVVGALERPHDELTLDVFHDEDSRRTYGRQV